MTIIQKLVGVYKIWQEFVKHFPKPARYTLGAKIESLLIEVIESVYSAVFIKRGEKLPFVKKAIIKLDLLKFFLQISWETKCLDTKKYIHLSEKFGEISKMLGGWAKQLLEK